MIITKNCLSLITTLPSSLTRFIRQNQWWAATLCRNTRRAVPATLSPRYRVISCPRPGSGVKTDRSPGTGFACGSPVIARRAARGQGNLAELMGLFDGSKYQVTVEEWKYIKYK